MAETKQKIYSIESDENGKLWDLRTVMAKTIPFKVRDKAGNNLSQDVYKINRFPFVYDLTTNTTVGSDSVEKYSTNDGILQDENGYFLFSERLLKECGIGFILASWLKLENNKIQVVFKKSYLKNWYSSPDDTPVVDDKIYSWNDFINKIYKTEQSTETGEVISYRGFPFLNQLNINNSPTTEACVIKKMASNWSDCTYTNRCDTSKITNEQWEQVLLSRRFPGVTLKYINCDSSGEETGGITDTKIPSGDSFIYPVINNYNSDYHYAFIIFNLPSDSEYNNIKANINPVQYGIFAEFIANNGKTLVYNHSGENITPNTYDNSTTSYKDVNSLIVSTDQNGETDIDLIEKYTLITTYMDDIIPTDTIPGVNKFSYKNIKRNNYKNETYIEVGKTYAAEPSAETTLEEKLNDPEEKWMTPSEYYSSKGVTASQANIEDPFGAIGEQQNWFWVETIKNWCVYVMESNGCLYLNCWNGKDGWDKLESIMNMKNTGFLQILADKYLYSQYFFAEGPSVQFDIYNPIRMPNGHVNTYYYRTLYLTRDTISKNYNNKFQSLHDTKIYQTGERYETSNVGIGVENCTTYSNKPITVDPRRQACFGVQNQYCPLVAKLINGNFGLYFVYHVNGNGYGVPNVETDPSFIIQADDANARCRDIFGTGDDKTIERDWKRFNGTNTDEEKATSILTDKEETIYGAASITKNAGDNKINSISLIANRPNPTTNNGDVQDYLERWDR